MDTADSLALESAFEQKEERMPAIQPRRAPPVRISSRQAALALLYLTFAVAARAEEIPGDWYVGLDGGQAKSPMDARGMSRRELDPGIQTGELVRYEPKKGGMLFAGGRRFNTYSAIEVGLFGFEPFGFTAQTVGHGELTGHVRVNGLYADFVGSLPLGAGFSVFGTIGAHIAQVHDTFDIADTSVLATNSVHNTDFNYNAGLGLRYDFTSNIGVRLRAQRYHVDKGTGLDVNIGFYTLGLVVGFGAPPPPVPAPAAEPAPAPAAEPAPSPTPTPTASPAPVPQVQTLSADSSFGFDKSVIMPSARGRLDDLARQAAGKDIEAITITGYADRVGDTAYNLKLSQRRADAVKTYLATRPELTHAPMEAVGKGDANPLTTPDSCPPKMPRAALIKCLQPDRRVEVEIKAKQPANP
jgi:OOP family OmpA-OmpF porin